jgi:TRAP-type C4-dicarboxylate transport system permease small subunit
MTKFWSKAARFIGRFYIWLIYISVAGVTLFTALQVALRFIPGIKLYGTAELITLFAAWMYLLGMGYVSYRNKHITADILDWLLKENSITAKYLGLIGSSFAIAVCVVYGVLAFDFIIMVTAAGQISPDIGYPRVLIVSSLGVGFIAMTIFSVYHFTKEIQVIKKMRQRRTP